MQCRESINHCISMKDSDAVYKYIQIYSIFTWYNYDNRNNEN